MIQDDTSTLIGNKNPPGFNGMADAEVERRLKGVNRIGQSIPPIADNFDTRAAVPSGPTVMTPTPGRDDNLFKSSKLPKVEQEIVSFLADERQDAHYYLPLSPAVENGKHVSVSTSLPSWKRGKVTRHAGAVRYDCSGRKNLKEMRDIPVQKLPAMVAQAQVRITVMSHFMGCQLRRSLKETKSLYEELEKVYDPKNPKFIKEVFKHCKDTCEDTLNWLGARDGLK
ncbi:RNA polymerase II C-terminal domain phosphatase-like 1 [Platanthera guangdongensis]|uniref:RNA polymerase II C-terminal domain phosphatase-like 1 n=1 Tax=Platanthera guangdongensis TaxID=2320717 RepID=A0ABR2LNC2_9ASPA